MSSGPTTSFTAKPRISMLLTVKLNSGQSSSHPTLSLSQHQGVSCQLSGKRYKLCEKRQWRRRLENLLIGEGREGGLHGLCCPQDSWEPSTQLVREQRASRPAHTGLDITQPWVWSLPLLSEPYSLSTPWTSFPTSLLVCHFFHCQGEWGQAGTGGAGCASC